MTSFDLLLRHLRAVLRQPDMGDTGDTDAIVSARRWLQRFKQITYADLPRTPLEALGRDETALYSLRRASDLLGAVLAGDREGVLEVARTLLELPLNADPFEGELLMLAASVAETAGGDPKPLRAQYGRYQARFGRVRAVAGLAGVLSDPQLAEMLEANPGAADSPPLSVPLPPPEGGFTPFAQGDDAALQTYPTEVRQLLEPHTARFAVSAATLVDLSTEGSGAAERIADMFLDFGDKPLPLLDEPLGLRFVFSEAKAVETFSTADGTLFDTEVARAEGRFYFKLRLPESWRAAQWPRHAFWSQLECCVLLSGD